jgi:hypothetical protein
MSNMTRATRACVHWWRDLEYFMIKNVWESKGEGLMHTCFSSCICFVLCCGWCGIVWRGIVMVWYVMVWQSM